MHGNHNALPIIWALSEAKHQGFKVNTKQLADWRKKSLKMNQKVPDESIRDATRQR